MRGVLVLLRGLPGSGKTTLAKSMFPEYVLCAADDYFDELGRFDPTHLGSAHQQCQRRVQALLAAQENVVVHNTFTQFWEMKPYLEMAQRMGFSVRVCHVESGLSDQQLADRNVHSVPASTIEKMRERWQPYPSEEVVRNEPQGRNHRNRRQKA